jgi:hypothetical protein
MRADTGRLKETAEAEHREMVRELGELLRSRGVHLIDDRYSYEGFGSWTVTLSLGDGLYEVGFDGRERSLGFKLLYAGDAAHLTPSVAGEVLQRGEPVSVERIHAFATDYLERAEAGDYVPRPPVMPKEPPVVRRSRLLVVGPCLVLGSVLAARSFLRREFPPPGMLRNVLIAQLALCAIAGLTGVVLTLAGWLRDRAS